MELRRNFQNDFSCGVGNKKDDQKIIGIGGNKMGRLGDKNPSGGVPGVQFGEKLEGSLGILWGNISSEK